MRRHIELESRGGDRKGGTAKGAGGGEGSGGVGSVIELLKLEGDEGAGEGMSVWWDVDRAETAGVEGWKGEMMSGERASDRVMNSYSNGKTVPHRGWSSV